MPNTYFQAAVLGAVSGMRSMGGAALASDHLSHSGPNALANAPLLRWLGTPRAALVFKFLAAGEIVADKLPMTPSRLAPGPLFGRLLFGGLSGAAICAADGKRAEAGAVVGALSAVASAYAFYHLRQWADQKTGLPDPVIAVAEDALAYGGGWAVLRER